MYVSGQLMFKTKQLCVQGSLIKRKFAAHYWKIETKAGKVGRSYLSEQRDPFSFLPYSFGRKVNLVALNLGKQAFFIGVHFLRWH